VASAFSSAAKFLEALYPANADDASADAPSSDDEAQVAAESSNANPLEALERWKATAEVMAKQESVRQVAVVTSVSASPEWTPESDASGGECIRPVESKLLPLHEESTAASDGVHDDLDIGSDDGQSAFPSLCGPDFAEGLLRREEHHGQMSSVKLLRLAFAEWSVMRSRAQSQKAAAIEEARQQGKRKQALSFWLCDGRVDLPMLRVIIQCWHEVTIVEHIRRSDRRSKHRLEFSPDEVQRTVSPVLASPAPMQRALGALLSDTHDSLEHVCFLGWRELKQKTRRDTAAAMWVMERMAMSQGGLVVQAVFWTWCRLAAQNRLPSWAAELQQDMRFLRQAHSPASSSPVDGFRACDKSGARGGRWKSWMIPVCVCIASIFVHMFLLAIQNGFTAKDSDGDGIVDVEDRCPNSSVSLNFRSSWRTDWDGDGCLDSVEDLDDDDDDVPDDRDLCPRTAAGARVDKDGCTIGQLDLQARGGTEPGVSPWYEAWQKVADAGLEVFLGALLTAAVNWGWSPMKAAVGHFNDRLKSFWSPVSQSP
jgi:hypothetical protein